MSNMDINFKMLATPKHLLDRLRSLENKRFGDDFSGIVRHLKRPYYRLSEADYDAVKALSGGADVLVFDGKTQVTFGSADGGWALMPLSRPI